MPTCAAADALPFHALDLTPDEVAARFRAARAAGRPRWLWPELAPGRWRAALAEIARVAAPLVRGEAEALDADGRIGADALGVAGFTSGMGALLGWWIERGTLAARPETAALLRLHLAHGRARAAALTQTRDDVLRLLEGAGVPAVLVKGGHTAWSVFPDPGTRPMSDVDLVVPPAGVPAARAALLEAGYASSSHRERPYHEHWAPPGGPRRLRALHLGHAESPWAVNLHDSCVRRLANGRFAGLEAAGGPETEEAALGGRAVRVLAGAWLPAYLALHASQMRENLTLVRLAELALVARGGVDWDALAALLERGRLAPHVHPAFTLAERLVPGSVPAGFQAFLAAHAGKRAVRRVAALAPADVQRCERLSRVLLARRPVEWARALARAAVPTTAPVALAAHYVRWLHRALRPLLPPF
jgi:hypothetical protein